ncbi:MAG TPA: DUF2116 family Zn-ribbon domain-containing protein [Arcobacter sp.]|jgi:hypothetical protein|nr:DUF2116 family Zn-ribbon domain-containing protein [Arcobacter sp.]
MSHCPFCKKKIAMSKAFCSRSCKENYFQLIAIQVPKLFLKRIYVFLSPEDREIEIKKFADRHKWRLDLLKNKIEEEAIKAGYVEGEEKN